MDEQVTPEDQTVPIYDISGEKPALGHVPHEDVQNAVISGNYSLPKGRDVQVISPEGSLGTVPAEDAPEAFKNGYQYATPTLLTAHEEKQHYESFPQQALGTAEALAKGVVGPLVPLAEKGLTKLGVEGLTPEAQRKREEGLGLAAPIAEAAGFVGSMFTGVGEAALLEKAGMKAAELAGQAITKGVARGATEAIGARLASGAAKVATEMALFQAGDEASKVVNDAPNSPGQAAANIGLSGLLGGVGGAAFTGFGMAAKKIINSPFLRDLSDRLAVRGSDVAPAEKLQHEFVQSINTLQDIGDEVNGVTGLKAEALAKLLPKEVTPEINSQVNSIVRTVENKISAMRADPVAYPERLVAKVEADLERFKLKALPEQVPVPFTAVEEHIPDTITMQKRLRAAAPVEAPIAFPRPEKTTGEIFAATDQLKKSLHDYSKGNFGPFAIPRHHEAYDFLQATTDLGHGIKTSLENPEIWGEAANVQKDVNKAWFDLIPFIKQVKTGFMQKVGDKFDIDQAKFKSYIGQSGRATTETIKQKQLAGFLKNIDQFHDVIENVGRKAGIDIGIESPALTTLRESVSTASPGTKFADLLYDKLGPTGGGEILGGAVGGALGHGMGVPEMGFLAGYLGKWALGPVFTSLIKPVMQYGPNMPAFRAATGYAKAVLDGNAQMTNAAAKLFETGSKTVPSHYMPTDKDIKKLDEQVKGASVNPMKLLNIAGNMEDYMPNHAQAMAKTAATAVTYLNGLRPQSVKAAPLDKEIPPSQGQQAAYTRQLEIAQQPLMVFQHMKDGTLQPADIKTLQTIYPDYYNKMSQEVMTAMTDHISKGENVPYKLRQSASLFLGQPLDSTMTPSSIQAIQSHYLAKAPQQQQAQQMTKKGTSKLGQVSKNMLTMNQSRAQRAEKA